MKHAKDIMTPSPACCTRESGVQDVALLMVKHNCGQLPVIESEENPKPVGVVTDRDIVCRMVGRWLGYATFLLLATILLPLPHTFWPAAGIHCPYL